MPREGKTPWHCSRRAVGGGDIDESFAIINADDYYSFDALKTLHDALTELEEEWA